MPNTGDIVKTHCATEFQLRLTGDLNWNAKTQSSLAKFEVWSLETLGSE